MGYNCNLTFEEYREFYRTNYNNHGSIMEINGKWYVFYHRQTGVNEYSRQAMLEPIDVAMGKDGMLYIGDVKYLNGEPVASGVVEICRMLSHTFSS